MADDAYTTQNTPFDSGFHRGFSNPGYVRRGTDTLFNDETPRRVIPRTATRPVRYNSRAIDFTFKAPVAEKFAPIQATASVAETQQFQQAYQPQIKAAKPKRLSKLFRLQGKSKLQLSFTGLAIAMVIAGGYVSLTGFKANQVAEVQAVKLTQQANAAGQAGTVDVSTSTSPPVPSTVKPSPKAVASYVVAPNLPKYLIIPKLKVDARVLSVGVTSTGALGTPSNVFDTAWYNESSEPGQPGAVLIDGHVSSWTTHGVFYGIKTLVAGDSIQIKRGDGTIFNYKVVSSQVYSAGNVDMTAAMTPAVSGQPGLNLITCTGDVIPGTSEFNERVVVFAEQV